MLCESKREIERNEAKQLSESKHIDFKGSKSVSSVARCSINCLFPAFWLECLIVYFLSDFPLRYDISRISGNTDFSYVHLILDELPFPRECRVMLSKEEKNSCP